MTLAKIKEVADKACKEFKVKRLYLFGSFARGKNGPESDIDLLVEFEYPKSQLSKRFFGLLHYFEDILGCDVDLLTLNSLKNPYFRRKIMKERISILRKY